MTRAPGTPPAFQIDRVWKIYGKGADALPREPDQLPPIESFPQIGLFGAVIDATFAINRGETFVIMGLSGSGKSTILRCLCGLIPATAGSILLDGQDIIRISDEDLRYIRKFKVGMVFQNYALLPHRNVVDNIALPLEIQGEAEGRRKRRALDLVELVGLTGKEASLPHQLSGGQQQRVGIARSLANDPEIWLLDEPFSALDPLIRRELQDELLRLQRMMKKTVVFITHDFDEAARLGNRIAIMRAGRVVQIGTPEELILSPASDYVGKFTENVDRSQVLTARAIMEPFKQAKSSAGEISSTAPIASFARDILKNRQPVAIVDDKRQIVGEVTPEAMLNALLPSPIATESKSYVELIPEVS
ncbi:ATP-binding cassette domain-containing protein [Hyphomicrobium sp.]|uniref:quaternary amine ABC transporter ATP-binding protein n=1 Tax=Hyphomicrobium sp. TaxID=82 RepID=UPI000FABCD79|nr:ATP-binding cassette domain-containing protein [Hyphomicrobium sp.]RUO97762.1 MAG: ATP-binding cassette domain-containing protein [Hyphomicrobium sp.]